MSCPSQQRHRTGCRLSPVRTLPLQPDAFACWWRPCGVTWDAGQSALRLYNGYNLCLCAMPAHLGQGPSSSSPKQWKSDGRVKIYNSVSARSPLTKSKKKKILESAAIYKCACQCTDGLSAAQNGRGAAERFSTHHESNPSRPTLCDQS